MIDPQNPTPKDLRMYGFSMTLFFGLLGWMLWWNDNSSFAYKLWIMGLMVFFLPALLFPRGLKPIFLVWMKIAGGFSFVMMRVILSLLYFTLFTGISVIQKIIKRDALDLKFPGNKESYWVDRSNEYRDPKHFKRLF